ncbi:MAG: hypothetical protein EU541_03420 [Promethearchaeota archaeon]|nr:MAG: hypothetical protein EU541_03420 [Candidatus Lokiarchaeota archaeon]
MILKQAEPTTLITDLLLAIEGFLFAIILLYLWFKNKDKKKTDSLSVLMWIGGFISIGLFSLFGAIAHGTFSQPLSDIVWPFTMIFGGICFIFILTGVIIYQKETDFLLLLLMPLVLVIIYFILGFITNWPFLLWVILLIICSVIIYIFSFKAKQEGKGLAIYLIVALTVILISGVVQAIGGIIGFTIDYGTNNEFLFQPHNDIFHIIAMVGLAIFFLGFWKQAKGKL